VLTFWISNIEQL